VNRLTPAGEMVRIQWEQLATRFRSIEIGEFVIMPNHQHGIIVIKETGTGETKKLL
jgi:putative transposase